MSERAAFEAAVAADPGDDAARLVFADWLDERGDHGRAEFVRVQVGRERLAPGDTARLDALAREDELLDAHGADWLPPLLPGLSACRWHRGFVDTLAFTADRCHVWADVLSDTLPVVNLRIGPPGHQAARLADCPALARVRGLSFAGASLPEDALEVLGESPHLGSLRELDLSGNRSLAEGAGEALPRASWIGQLEALSLAGTALRTGGVVALLGSGSLTGLSALDLSIPWLGLEELRAVAELPDPGRLAHLRLANAQNAGPSALLASGRLDGLAELHLTNCRLERPLSECPGLGGVRALRLERVTAAFDLAADLATFAGQCWPGLEVLELADNRLTDRDVTTLATCPGLSGLSALLVEGYELTGRSLAALAESPFLRRLAILRARTWSAWAGAEVLGRAGFRDELRCIDLGAVSRPAQVASALAGCPRLHWAAFSGRKAGPAAALVGRWRPFPGTWPGRDG